MSSHKIAMVAAGLMGALWLPSTAKAQSVTPERALLNHGPAVSSSTAAAVAVQPALIDGERALLNRFYTITPTPVGLTEPVAESASVDGVKALLNRSSS